MPPKLSQAWSLCEEWLLVEAERAMLRLIWDLDHCLPQIHRPVFAHCSMTNNLEDVRKSRAMHSREELISSSSYVDQSFLGVSRMHQKLHRKHSAAQRIIPSPMPSAGGHDSLSLSVVNCD